MKDTGVPETHCKHCQSKLDMHTGAFENNIKPKKNDLSVCARCGHISRFNEDLNLVPLTRKELFDLLENHHDAYMELKKVSEVILLINKKKEN